MDDPRSTSRHAGEALPDAKLTIKMGDNEIHLEARPEIVRQELDRLVDRLLPATAAGTGSDPVARDPVARDPVVVSVTAPAGGGTKAPVVTTAGATGREKAAQAPVAAKAEVTGPKEAAKVPAKEAAEPVAAALDFIARLRGRQGIRPGVEKLLKHVSLAPERIAELYAVDPRGRVLLKKLPAATRNQVRDTVLLLLYGTLTMCGETSESGYRLVQAMRGLGLRIDRVPRAFGPDSDLAISFGRHRGKRYRLTAGGIRYCERLVPALLRALQG